MHEPTRKGGDGTTAPQAVPTATLSKEDLETLAKMRELLDRLQGGPSPQIDPAHVEWTNEGWADHMVTTQRIRLRGKCGKASTGLNYQRYVNRLEHHPVVPVALRPPCEQSWLDHVAYRLGECKPIQGTGLNLYRRALKSLLRYLGIPEWSSLVEPYDELAKNWRLPSADSIPLFWTATRYPYDQYLEWTYHAIFHYGFHVGCRPPSEYVLLELDDIDWSNREIMITEEKKGGNRRVFDEVPDDVLHHPEVGLRYYIDEIRPLVDTGESSAVFLDKLGRPFDKVLLGTDLSTMGKQIWPEYVNYTMRRWFATSYLIESGDIYETARRLGDTVRTVEMHYVDHPRVRRARRERDEAAQVEGVGESVEAL